MKIRLQTRKLFNLTDSEVCQLRKLSFQGWDSLMKSALDRRHTTASTAVAIIAYYGNQPIGWSCVKSNGEVYAFVKPCYRRKGVGHRLLKKALRVIEYKRYGFNIKSIRVYRTHYGQEFYKKTLGLKMDKYCCQKVLTKVKSYVNVNA